ncbi:hypothetical protein LSAT2_018943, partial [Lamellibrachia satsuma]
LRTVNVLTCEHDHRATCRAQDGCQQDEVVSRNAARLLFSLAVFTVQQLVIDASLARVNSYLLVLLTCSLGWQSVRLPLGRLSRVPLSRRARFSLTAQYNRTPLPSLSRRR